MKIIVHLKTDENVIAVVKKIMIFLVSFDDKPL